MKKSIAKLVIIFLICLILLIIPLIIPLINGSKNEREDYKDPVNIISKNSIISFSGEQVIVTDTYDIDVNTDVPYLWTEYDMKVDLIEKKKYVDMNDHKPMILKIVLDNEEMYVEDYAVIHNGERFEDAFYPDVYMNGNCSIWTNYIGLEKSGRRKLELTYAYDIEKVVREYDDVCVMKLRGGSGNTKIILPKDTDDIKTVASGTTAIKESANTFFFNNNALGKKFDSKFTILIEKNVINGGERITGNYLDTQITNLFNNKAFVVVILFSSGVLICFILSSILVKKPKFKNIYIRDAESVVSPLLAEALIDGKIGAKECIMTCILSAIKKGNIEVINNETIKLLTYNNLTFIEKIFIKFIFNGVGRKTKIRDLKNTFIENNIESEKFYEAFLKVKKHIVEELKWRNIYNKFAEGVLKIIRVVSILIFVNIIPILLSFTQFAVIVSVFSLVLIIVNATTLVISIKLIISEKNAVMPKQIESGYYWRILFNGTINILVLIPSLAFIASYVNISYYFICN